MPRWTTTLQEQVRIAEVSRDLPIGGLVEIELIDGGRLEGVLHRSNVGNNAGTGGWQYYGECEVQSKGGQRWVVDFLDIASVRNAWSEQLAAEYEELGLIEIQRQTH